MTKLQFALFVIGIIVILYLLYNYNNKTYVDVERLDTVSPNSNKPKLSVYYTEWCGYSQQFLESLNNGLRTAIFNNGVDLEVIDCDKNQEKCKKYNIDGFPTVLLHTLKNSNGYRYNGPRDEKLIINFINTNKNN
jgi:thiol-disulfide isomerase/thioredoxin